MRVRDARALAGRWVAEHAAEVPGFAGALLGGSLAWLPEDAELPGTSDVDVMVVTGDPGAGPGRSKRRYGGVLLEATVVPWQELASPEQVLASYHLAGVVAVGAVLADPTGRLADLKAATAPEFPRRPWVRRRCGHAERRILDGLAGVDPSAPLPAQVTAWLFPTGVTTHVLLTAGLRNPTIRLRYLAAGALLADYGHAGVQEELLGLLGCARLPRRRAERHLAAMTAAFDDAAAVAATPFPFASDITAEARPVAVDGSRDLVARGRHREAVYWIVATYARCLTILASDAQPSTLAGHTPGFEALLADLGVASPADLARRARAVVAFLPRLREVTDAILAANPAVRD